MDEEKKNLAADTAPIPLRLSALTSEHVAAFRKATITQHFGMIPPTFATYFRWPEFEWLKRLNVDFKQLLHTDQEYEYISPLRYGDIPEMATSLAGIKERRGLKFIRLETNVFVNGDLRLISRTTFVVRRAGTSQVPQ